MKSNTSRLVRALACLPFVLSALSAVSGCGGKSREAESPENADETESSSDSKDSKESKESKDRGDSKEHHGSGGATVKDDDEKGGAMKCGGFDVPDLVAVISQASCELPDGTPEPKEEELKDVLDVRVSADQHVTPGSKANKVRVLYKNKGKSDLTLKFVVDPDPRFSFEVSTPKGARVDKPAGAEPSLPPGVGDAPAPEKKYAQITIAANGTAGVTLSWDAVKYKWASKERARGAVPGRGYPRDPAGPLPKGKYVLRVVTPLVGVSEGVDHELSQPKTDIQVGGT
jgi:hypothetical protein